MINDLRIKQIVVFIVGGFLMLLVSPTTTLAQTTSFEPLPASISNTSPVYSELIVSNLFHTLSCLAVGQSNIGQPCLNYQMTKDAQGIISSVPVLSKTNLSNGALGSLTSMIGGLYANPPVRAGDYVASVGKNLGFVKEANAQVVGSGANVLAPILSLWAVSRNIAYLAMIIIFVVIGIMVMFRKKLNPQTVITAQSALPGLVIGLILITFSYFLAGLISDTAFIGTNIVGYYFKTVSPGTLDVDLTTNNFLKIFSKGAGIITFSDMYSILSNFYDDLDNGSYNPLSNPKLVLSNFLGFIAAQTVLPFAQMGGGITQVISGLVTFAGVAAAPVATTAASANFIIVLMLLYAMFKLLLRLLNSYLMIIFLVVTAPFHFLISALPGKQGFATNWILNLFANVLVFPAVLAMFYLASFLSGRAIGPISVPPVTSMDSGTITVFATNHTPSISGRETFPLLGGFDLKLINVLLAFAALLATPTIPDLVVQTFGRPGKAGGAINQTIVGTIGAGRGYAGQTTKGMQGMAGQVGRLTDTPVNYMNEEGGITSLKANSPENVRAGARIGQAYIWAANLKKWTGWGSSKSKKSEPPEPRDPDLV